MEDDKQKQKKPMEMLSLEEAMLRIFKLYLRETVFEILTDDIDLDKLIDARTRAIVEKMRREH